MAAAESSLRAIPRGVWALGLVSLFMDTSSELVHSLLPVFLVRATPAEKRGAPLGGGQLRQRRPVLIERLSRESF